MISTEDRKRCSYCAEWIRKDDVSCKYCGKDILDITTPEVMETKQESKAVPIEDMPEERLPVEVESILIGLRSADNWLINEAIFKAANLKKPYKQIIEALEKIERSSPYSLQRQDVRNILNDMRRDS